MFDYCTVRLALVCVLVLFQTSSVMAQAKRSVDVKVLDEASQPVPNAAVIVRAAGSLVASEMLFDQKRPPGPCIIGQTDATGAVKIDVTSLDDTTGDALYITIWKKGFGPQSMRIQNEAQFKLFPLKTRKFQILDANDKPQSGLTVERQVTDEEQSIPEELRWWSTNTVQTNEFGVAEFDTDSGGRLGFIIVQPDGVRHSGAIAPTNRFRGRMTDLRDLNIIRISPHGKLTGQLPAEFAQDFRIRLTREYRGFASMANGMWTTFPTDVSLTATGTFESGPLTPGGYWVAVFRNKTTTANQSPVAKQPVALQRVEVKPGETVQLDIATEPVTKVSGKVVCQLTDPDYSTLRLMVTMAYPIDSTSSLSQAMATAEVAADGTFTFWLPKGRFDISAMSNEKWRTDRSLSVEVGAGAATISTDNLVVVATKAAKVRWKIEQPWNHTWLNFVDRRITFQLSDKTRTDCNLSIDGYGKVVLPVGAEVAAIHRDSMGLSRDVVNQFNDLDPSENFDLELIPNLQGVSTSATLRGRVVNQHGEPLKGVPVKLSLTHVPHAQYPSSNSTGTKTIDIVWSDAEGKYEALNRPLFQNLSILGRNQAIDADFIFTASTSANPWPIEVTKKLSASIQAWKETEIELPDLVIDRPLDGKQLNGKLLMSDGQPSPGELIRVADKGQITRTLTDRDGAFSIDNLAGPIWVLRQRDWSIHSVSDYSGTTTLTAIAESPTVANSNSSQLQQRKVTRLDPTQRRALAKQVLDKISIQNFFGQTTAIDDDFYLKPDQFLERLVLLKSKDADALRVQFATFWNGLPNEQLERLAEASQSEATRIRILKRIADRNPSAASYEKLMDELQVPDSSNGIKSAAASLLPDLADLGLKLHRYGKLDPYRHKIQQILEIVASEMAKRNDKDRAGQFLLELNDKSLGICRALIDPDSVLTEGLSLSIQETNKLPPEEGVRQRELMSLALKVSPLAVEGTSGVTLLTVRDLLNDIGEQDPLRALELVKNDKLPVEALRAISTGAFNIGRAEAPQLFEASIPLLLRVDANQMRTSSLSSIDRHAELAWYTAARRSSAKFGRMAAWQLALDYLDGLYDPNAGSTLYQMDRSTPQIVTVAYCLAEDFPELSQQITQRYLPKMFQAIEHEFGQSLGRMDALNMAAWLNPQATTDFLIEFHKQQLELQKNEPAGKPDPARFNKARSMNQYRENLLRGLLVDEL